jgi:hypothetical protein
MSSLLGRMAVLLSAAAESNSQPAATRSRETIDLARLQREQLVLRRTYRANVYPVLFRGRAGRSWDDYGVIAAIDRWVVTGRYDRNHPYAPPRFAIDPAPVSRHYYDDGRGLHLCWCGSQEWNPDWTIATGLGAVHRFLGLLDRGKVD